MNPAGKNLVDRDRGLGAVTIRRVRSDREYDECVTIQREIWGREFRETVPATILRISQEVGGVTAAAFDADDAMLGFVFGISGIRDGELAHWSDMLAVRPSARDLGLGKRLKYYQRDLLLADGIGTMYWTFDPLVARNAYVNLEQLGARVTEYRTNYYGEHTGSVMHTGIGTDRFIVEWRLDAELHSARSAGEWNSAPLITQHTHDLPTGCDRLRVAVPDDIVSMLDGDISSARAFREATRRAFTTFLGRGYIVTGFTRANELHPACYLLEH